MTNSRLRAFCALSLLLAILPLPARGSDDLRACYESILGDPSLQQLSALGELLSPLLKTLGALPSFADEQGSAQSRLVRNRPDLWLLGMHATCEAWTLSWALCGDKFTYGVEDSEIDAVRHFLFASRLSVARGRTLAQRVLAAHEGNPADWNGGNRMDAVNNLVALEWVDSEKAAGHKITRARILEEALVLVRAKKLVTLRAVDPGQCAWESRSRLPLAALLKSAKRIRSQLPGAMKKMCRLGI